MRISQRLLVVLSSIGLLAFAAGADAQVTAINPPADTSAQQPPPEQQSGQQDPKARRVGRKGAKQSTFAFSLDATQSASSSTGSSGSGGAWSGNYTGFLQQGFFTSNNLVLKFGTLFSGDVKGDSSTVGFTGGLVIYATPSKPASLYVSAGGGVLSTQSTSSFLIGTKLFTETSTSASGQLFGALGFEGVTSPNSSLFFEGQFSRLYAFSDTGQSLGENNNLLLLFGIRVIF